MTASAGPTSGLLKELATLVVAVAGESVTMVKRSLPERALKLKKRQEWDIYLEFLKLLFDLTDRLAGLYVPIQEQPHFMESLEDTVTQQMRLVLEPALGPDSDEMEIVLTIGQAVTDSRQQYERFRFMVTEDSQVKEEYFRVFSQRIAQLMDAPDNGLVMSSATLCASAAVPAITAVLTGAGVPSAQESTVERTPRVGEPRLESGPASNEIKLASVISTVKGEEVETWWRLHPRFRQDLKPEHLQELTRLMNRATQILGHRYASVAFTTEWAPWNRIGHA
jgi:hypothetical protein